MSQKNSTESVVRKIRRQISKKYSSEEKVRIVLVEQDVVNSLGISDRAYVMEQGQVVIEGTIDELMNDPQNKKVFLGLKIAIHTKG